jgi:hypothetical protein
LGGKPAKTAARACLAQGRTGGIAARPPFAIFHPLYEQGAEMAQESEYQAGSMDISQHKKVYEGFVAFVKWSFAGIMLIMILLAIFRT